MIPPQVMAVVEAARALSAKMVDEWRSPHDELAPSEWDAPGPEVAALRAALADLEPPHPSPDKAGPLAPGALVSFPHRTSTVVGYVLKVETSVAGTPVAVCMGLLVHPENDTGFPQASMRWRVPGSDVTVLGSRSGQPSENREPDAIVGSRCASCSMVLEGAWFVRWGEQFCSIPCEKRWAASQTGRTST